MYKEIFFIATGCLNDIKQRELLLKAMNATWNYNCGAVITGIAPGGEISYVQLASPCLKDDDLEKWAKSHFPDWLEIAARLNARIFTSAKCLETTLLEWH